MSVLPTRARRALVAAAWCGAFIAATPVSALADDTPTPSPSATATATTGSITGTITGADTQEPIRHVCVVATIGTKVKKAQCGPRDGVYTLNNLAPGVYNVGFTTFIELRRSGSYIPTWYGGDSQVSSATPVTVTAGEQTTGIDEVLPLGGVIAGKAVDATTGAPLGKQAEACIFVYPVGPLTEPIDYPNARGLASAECSDSFHAGEYSLGGLPTGDYLVRYYNDYGNGQYVPQWYDASAGKAHATRVHVTAGKTTTLKLAKMQRSGAIAGKVVDAGTGKPLDGSDFYVYAYRVNDSKNVVSRDYWVESDGKYFLPQLTTGSYKIEFVANGDKYKTFWYGGTSFASATPLSVTTGQVTGLHTQRMDRRS